MRVVSIAQKVSMNVISASRLSIMETPAAARGDGKRRGDDRRKAFARCRGDLETLGSVAEFKAFVEAGLTTTHAPGV